MEKDLNAQSEMFVSTTWNGLEITDVPGIGAFEGEDDAPQVAEEECFSWIMNLGKPIIGGFLLHFQ